MTVTWLQVITIGHAANQRIAREAGAIRLLVAIICRYEPTGVVSSATAAALYALCANDETNRQHARAVSAHNERLTRPARRTIAWPSLVTT